MIYIDNPNKSGWSHLISTDIQELHNFATQIGLKPSWFQDKPNKPHYDIKGIMIKRALTNGAILVSSKEIIRILKEYYQDNI